MSNLFFRYSHLLTWIISTSNHKVRTRARTAHLHELIQSCYVCSITTKAEKLQTIQALYIIDWGCFQMGGGQNWWITHNLEYTVRSSGAGRHPVATVGVTCSRCLHFNITWVWPNEVTTSLNKRRLNRCQLKCIVSCLRFIWTGQVVYHTTPVYTEIEIHTTIRRNLTIDA